MVRSARWQYCGEPDEKQRAVLGKDRSTGAHFRTLSPAVLRSRVKCLPGPGATGLHHLPSKLHPHFVLPRFEFPCLSVTLAFLLPCILLSSDSWAALFQFSSPMGSCRIQATCASLYTTALTPQTLGRGVSGSW